MCDYCDFYEAENLMPPVHACPAPAPIVIEDDEFYRGPRTPLEHELARSLGLAFGIASGKIVDARGRWS